MKVVVDVNRMEYDINALVKGFSMEKELSIQVVPYEEEFYRSNEENCIFISFTQEFPFIRKNDFLYRGKSAYETYDKNNEIFLKTDKNEVKKFLYYGLAKAYQKTLPWGNLTGIRPSKIAMNMLKQGGKEEDVIDFFINEHCTSYEKAQLTLEVAKREKELLGKLDVQNGFSLYIGIPFCPTTCLYCSFTSFPICLYQSSVEKYLECLEKEIAFIANNLKGKKLDTIYVGGGTPTTLGAGQLHKLLSMVEKYLDTSSLIEFTVEAGRPDSITREKLVVLKEHNISRISINPQTMNDETLKLIGRQHSVAEVIETYKMARELDFHHINMDLILGLPGETSEHVQNTMRQIKELAPDSITVHSLAIKRASKLQRMMLDQDVQCVANTDETMEYARQTANELGLKPYYLYRQKNMSGNFENVGYAKEGQFGVYNVLIMEEVQTIMAVGAGSISKLVLPDGRIERADNIKDVKLYMEKIDEMIQRKEELLKLQGLS